MSSRIVSVWTVLILAVGLLTGIPTAPAAAADAHGQVLSVVELPVSALPAAAAKAVKITYATRTQRGHRAEADGIVYYPKHRRPAGGWKVVAWAHGTSGIGPECAPSRQSGEQQDRIQPNIGAALRRGYVVTASDYIGLSGTPKAEYLGGRSVAHNVLDLVRAARSNDPDIGKRFALLGHSQGGHAVLWSAYLARSYTPELRSIGAVPMAPANHLELVVGALGNPATPGIGPVTSVSPISLYLLDGVANAYPESRATDYLTPLGKQWLAKARVTCVGDLSEALADVAPRLLFRRPLNDPSMSRYLSRHAGIPDSGWPRTPIRIEQGLTDLAVLAPTTMVLTGRMRAGGANVTLTTYPGDHMSVIEQSMKDTYAAIDRWFG